jgi:hypothetical protein
MTERYTVWRARELGLGEGSTFEEILEGEGKLKKFVLSFLIAPKMRSA